MHFLPWTRSKGMSSPATKEIKMQSNRWQRHAGVGFGWVVALFFSAVSHPSILRAQGVDYFWTNTATGGNYTNTQNWLTGVVPPAIDDAIFRSNGTYQIDWTASITNRFADFDAPGANQVTLNIGDGNKWTLTSHSAIGSITGSRTNIVRQISGTLETVAGAMNAGNGTSHARYILENGTLLTHDLNALYGTGSGFLITGPNSVVTNQATASIGGQFSIGNQFVVSNQATVVGTGAGSFFTVGAFSDARDATLKVTGTGSVLTLAGELRLQDGTNSLGIVSDGGLIQAAQTQIGRGNNGAGVGARFVVTDPGSVLTNSGVIVVGGCVCGKLPGGPARDHQRRSCLWSIHEHRFHRGLRQ